VSSNAFIVVLQTYANEERTSSGRPASIEMDDDPPDFVIFSFAALSEIS
jgi:hypothetical protein